MMGGLSSPFTLSKEEELVKVKGERSLTPSRGLHGFFEPCFELRNIRVVTEPSPFAIYHLMPQPELTPRLQRLALVNVCLSQFAVATSAMRGADVRAREKA